MKKATRILLTIGTILSLFTLLTFVLMVAVSFFGASPDYYPSLVRQLKEGTITSSFPGTYEEQATQIQKMFIVLAIVFIILSVDTLAKLVFGVLSMKTEKNNFYIITLVLSVIGLDAIMITGSILGLVANKNEEETIEVY